MGELVQRTDLSQPNTSNHLACLADCQLVEREPDGRYARYRLKHARVKQILVLSDALLLEIGSAIAACPRTGAPINGSAGRRDREALVRRGMWLSAATIAYNSLEGGMSVIVGLLAGSIVLVGFGIDSVIEVVAGLAALWRLWADVDPARRARAERQTLQLVGASFLLLAAYVAYEAFSSLATHAAPSRTTFGILIAAASLIVMPLLASAKRRVAIGLASDALASEARQTVVCTYLSGIVLLGLGLNAAFGWWWADPVAALAMVPFITREGVEAVGGHGACAGTCGDV